MTSLVASVQKSEEPTNTLSCVNRSQLVWVLVKSFTVVLAHCGFDMDTSDFVMNQINTCRQRLESQYPNHAAGKWRS